MGAEVKVEVDQALLDRLRAAGMSLEAYVERELRRRAAAFETPEERAAREAALRAEMQPGLDQYDRLVDEAGDWAREYRPF